MKYTDIHEENVQKSALRGGPRLSGEPFVAPAAPAPPQHASVPPKGSERRQANKEAMQLNAIE